MEGENVETLKKEKQVLKWKQKAIIYTDRKNHGVECVMFVFGF